MAPIGSEERPKRYRRPNQARATQHAPLHEHSRKRRTLVYLNVRC
jgi:hypothetical protein